MGIFLLGVGDFGPERFDFWPERVDFWPERADLWPERVDFGSVKGIFRT